MRIYYIFNIKNDIYQITKNKPQNLYNALEKIHLMSQDELSLSIKMYEKLVKSVDKKNIDLLIRSINKDNINYMCFNNTHIVNDFYTGESTKLIINNSYMKVKSNASYPSFLKDIKKLPNLFVCDFVNMDYFYLSEISFRTCTKV